MDSSGSMKPQEVLTVLIGQRPMAISRFHPLFVHPLFHILGMFLELVVAATKPFLPRALVQLWGRGLVL